jgi:hypothetical protein
MTQQHHFETAQLERSNRAQSKKRASEERQRLARIDALRRMRQRTEAALTDLKNSATLLDHSIETELQSSATRDPRHYHESAFQRTSTKRARTPGSLRSLRDTRSSASGQRVLRSRDSRSSMTSSPTKFDKV